MEIVVVGKHVEVPSSVRDTTKAKVAKVERFANDVRRVEVDYGKTRNPRVAAQHTCEILVHVTGHLVKGHASAGDFVTALDLALDRVDHQMRRLHERRVHRKGAIRKGGRNNGNGAVAVPDDDAAELPAEAVALPEVSTGGALPEAVGPEAEHDAARVIVKTKQFSVKPMSPDEAALQMDLLGHGFYLFTNSETASAAVIYRRSDGHYGLIESAD